MRELLRWRPASLALSLRWRYVPVVILALLTSYNFIGCATKSKPSEEFLQQKRLENERKHTETSLAKTEPQKRELVRELISNATSDEEDTWHGYGDFQFRLKYIQGYRHPILVRKPIRAQNEETNEETVVDINSSSTSSFDVELSSIQIEASGHKLGYILEGSTGERVLFVKDLDTEKLYASDLKSPDAFVWAGSDSIFVTTRTGARPDRAYLFDLKTGETYDKFLEPRADHYLSIQALDNGRAVLYSNALDDFETYILEAAASGSVARVPGEHTTKQLVRALGNKLVVLYQPMSGPETISLYNELNSAPSASWRSSSPHYTVQDVRVQDGSIILLSRESCSNEVMLLNSGLERQGSVKFDQHACGTLKVLEEGQGASLKVQYSNLVMPPSLYELNLPSLIAKKISGPYTKPKPAGTSGTYLQQTLYAKSPDGTSIPISLAYRAHQTDAATKKPMPVLLTAYGAYGESFNTAYTEERRTLLDHGFAYAVCHVRGGGELGRGWHLSGRGLNKIRSIQDLEACATALQESPIIDSSKMFGYGRSAGGLLLAASMLRSPDLFRAVVLEAPFLDVLGASLNKQAAHRERELSEWGDPTEESALRAILSYSPFNNIKPGRYPATLVIHSQDDQLIPAAQSLEWVTRVRAANQAKSPILFDDHFGGKHEHAQNYFEDLEKWAEIYAFFEMCLCIYGGPEMVSSISFHHQGSKTLRGTK